MILDKIESLLVEVKEMKASNAEEIEALRLKYLSKKGEINAVMADFRNVPADQKKEVGMKINELKQTALERLNALRDAIETSEDSDQGRCRRPCGLPRCRGCLRGCAEEPGGSAHGWC